MNLLSELLAIEGLKDPIPISEHIFDLDRCEELKRKMGLKRRKIKYLLPQKREIFSGVSIVDIESKALLFKEGVYEDEEEKIIILPFSLQRSLKDRRLKAKYFYFHPQKFPYEFVSLVSKGDVRKLFFNAIRRVYSWLGMEYRHIWYYPAGFRSAFIFRLDTDFAKKREIIGCYQILRGAGINATWFVNAKEHENLLPLFLEFKKEGGDVQLHCFVHQVFPDYKRNYKNLLKGKEILKEGGIIATGFAAPFGLANPSLYSALLELGFSFSSEFGLSYDDFPFYVGEELGPRILQIPCHPICVSRLLEARFNEKEMYEYYRRYIEWRYRSCLPIFIYDHPHRVCQFPELFRQIVRWVKERGDIWITTMADFYSWWREREEPGGRACIHIIRGDKEGFFRKEGVEFVPRREAYFTMRPPRRDFRLLVKSVLWRASNYLKGKVR